MKHNFKIYCKEPEKIENYEKAKADDFKGWEVHHRLETHNSDGERRLVDISYKELKALGMYYNRPASELIFLTKSEHNTLHRIGRYTGENNPMYGKKLSEETKKKLSEAAKGNKNMLGKKHSEETRKKIGAAAKGKPKSEETKKKMREAKKGENNAMYGKHHTDEARRKMSEKAKGKNFWTKGTFWFNNGKINIRAKECPPGFVPGRLI